MARVSDGLNSNNPARHAHNRKPLDGSAIVLRYESGESENAIAKSLNVNRWAIRRRLLEAGVAVRGQSAAELVKWSHMSSDARSHQVAAAHIAATGRVPTGNERAASALAHEHSMSYANADERKLADFLRRANVTVVPQKACGPYNIDIAVENTVAVEVFGGGWHAERYRIERFIQRAKYLFDQGWHLYVIWIDQRRYPLGDLADDIIAFGQQASGTPAPHCQYRVVRGNGEFIASGRSDDDRLTFIPTSSRGDDGRFRTDGAR